MVKKYTRRKHRSKQRGGFRYGNKTKHTPIPGEVLISSPQTMTKTRTKTRTMSKTRTKTKTRSKTRGRKPFNWF